MKCPNCNDVLERTCNASTLKNVGVSVEYFCNNCQDYYIWRKGYAIKKICSDEVESEEEKE